MHERGYEAVGVAELCEAADVKRGSFYFHFPSKQALALAMLDRAWQHTWDTLLAVSIDDERLSTADAFERYGQLLADHLAKVQRERGVVVGCRFGNFAAELSNRDPVIRQRVGAILDDLASHVAATLSRGVERGELPPGVDASAAARRIVAHMEGLMVLAKAHRDPDLLRDLGPTALALAGAAAVTTGAGGHATTEPAPSVHHGGQGSKARAGRPSSQRRG